jgi:hypothetical protein
MKFLPVFWSFGERVPIFWRSVSGHRPGHVLPKRLVFFPCKYGSRKILSLNGQRTYDTTLSKVCQKSIEQYCI